MSDLNILKCVKKVCSFLVIFLIVYAPLMSQAQAADVVTTYQDENGWKLQVNGDDFYIKGVVWSYVPRDENFNYNLWAESDGYIRRVLDQDFGLMKAAGVNAIRTFNMIPPKWISYIYEEHGIMTVINPDMGRYGYQVAGKWYENTDYSDELTRSVIKADMLVLVEKYKNTPGLLMFALGNENNYGLSWSSLEIENLPVGERNAEKARYLYTLFNDIIAAGKRIDKNHPFAIVNGDIQYINLIGKYVPALDILGMNAYRGKTFSNIWKEVKTRLDLPLLFMEFGSDAYNARTGAEDMLMQAEILKDQWQEMYSKSYGNGEEGISIGGFVFEWRDEWWKHNVGEQEDMDVHDTTASWASDNYPVDYVAGENNMNEEWWGITRLGSVDSDGVYTAQPRMAYDMLTEVWKIDPYVYKKAAINQSMTGINMDYLELKGDVRALKEEASETTQKIRLSGARIETKFIMQGFEDDIKEDGEEGIDFQSGQMLFLDFEFAPTDKITGQASLNILGSVPDEYMEISYGMRGETVSVLQVQTVNYNGVPETVVVPVEVQGSERVEIYDFEASYQGENYDINSFYHVPRYHWGYEGDFFGLVRETTDMAGEDIWNAKAPEGAEFVGKGNLEGLKIVGGPEIYWGANPKVVLKYWQTRDLPLIGETEYAFIHSEDVSRTGQSSTATAPTTRQSRATTLFGKTNVTDSSTFELGLIAAASEKIDDKYTRVSGSKVIQNEIDFEDTLGMKARLTWDMFGSQAYVAGAYQGLVADGGAAAVPGQFATLLPYSELGNKKEIDAGLMMTFGHWMVFPRALWRENLIDANPLIPPSIDGDTLTTGASPRNTDADPFAVLDNREARSAEVFVTYDPTGATPFYAWDNDSRENATFAMNFGANYTEWRAPSDANLFFFEPTGDNASFGVGLPSQDTWAASSRMVINPNNRLRLISNLLAAYQQSSGDPTGGTRRFYEWEGKAFFDRKHILSGYVKKDAWGPYDFHEQFNITYPWQYKLDYSYLLDERGDELTSSKIGFRALYRTLDSNSPGDEYDGGANDYMFETIFYVNWAF
jgi:hypothetical protein